MHNRGPLPETVTVNISNPGIEELKTAVSTLEFTLVAVSRQVNRKLDAIIELVQVNPQDAEAVAKIRAVTAKLKTDTDKLEGEVQKHVPEGQE